MTIGTTRNRPKTLKATYDFAVHTHGSIGPSCAVAEFRDGQLTCWSASQATHNLRKQLANMLAMPPEPLLVLPLLSPVTVKYIKAAAKRSQSPGVRNNSRL